MIRLVTFNLRYPTANDGENYFPFRLPGIIETIKRESPDVIGFQEMTDDSFRALSPMLPEYDFYGVHRDEDLRGESSKIAYRRDRFMLISADTFWLSPLPRVPGSRYADQSNCPRVCSWVKLYCRDNGQFFYFINLHLDHLSESARYDGLQLVMKTAARLLSEHDIPLFITGDFNCFPEEAPYCLIQEYGFIDLTDGIKGTFHGFGVYEDKKIDYILTNQPRERFLLSLWEKSACGTYLSDHKAIAADWDNDIKDNDSKRLE